MKDTNSIHKKIRHYRSLCQKGASENYIFDKYVVRKISIYFTIPFIWLKVQPNQATLLSLISLISSYYFFLFNSKGMLLSGALLIFLYYMLDHVDGELARYYSSINPTKKRGLDGKYFDILCHSYSANVILFLFGFASYRHFHSELILLFAFFISLAMNRAPEQVAKKTLIQIIAYQPENINKSDIKMVLQSLEKRTGQIAAVQASIMNPIKLKKIAKETVGFPGILVLIILASILDAFLPNFRLIYYTLNFRTLLIVLLIPIELARIINSWIQYMKLFRSISAE